MTLFEQKVVHAGPPKNPKAPSALAQFQNKLRSIYFEGLEPSQVRAALSGQKKFLAYPELKITLELIFSLDENSDLSQALRELQAIGPEWDAPHLDEQWEALDTQYGYFSSLNYEQEAQYKLLFKQLTKSCRKIAVLFEENNTPEDTIAYDYAYKLMALFIDPEQPIIPSAQIFDKVAKETYQLLSQSDIELSRPLHDVLLVALSLPQKKDVRDIAGWRKLIKQVGSRVFPFFAIANQMEEKISQCTDSTPRAPGDISEAKAIYAQIQYKRASEDPDFAILCREYKYPEEWFNRCLDYMQEPPGWPKKEEDNIPIIDIEGTGVSTGFRLQNLPTYDKRALILGEMTGCCQSFGRHSEQCARDGIALSDNGFYVITKKGPGGKSKIIGQAYAWRTQSGSLCLDSIESSQGSISDEAIKDMLSRLAQQILAEHPDIKVVTLGRGGQTPTGIFPEAPIAERINQGYQYMDSKTQYFIMGQAQQKYGFLPYNIASSEFLGLLESMRNYVPIEDGDKEEIRLFLAGRMSARMQTLFSSVIQDKDDAREILGLLPPEQLLTFVKDAEGELADYIPKDADSILHFISFLPIEQGKFIVDLMKEKLSSITLDELFERYCSLRESTRRDICIKISSLLPNMIKSYIDLHRMLQFLTTEHNEVVVDMMKDKFPSMITSGIRFKLILEEIKPKRRAEIYYIVKDVLLKSLVSSAISTETVKTSVLKDNIERVTGVLSPELASDYYQAVKALLPADFNLEALIKPPKAPEVTSTLIHLGTFKDGAGRTYDTEDDGIDKPLLP